MHWGVCNVAIWSMLKKTKVAYQLPNTTQCAKVGVCTPITTLTTVCLLHQLNWLWIDKVPKKKKRKKRWMTDISCAFHLLSLYVSLEFTECSCFWFEAVGMDKLSTLAQSPVPMSCGGEISGSGPASPAPGPGLGQGRQVLPSPGPGLGLGQGRSPIQAPLV